MISIRDEKPSDFEQVRNVTVEAFACSEFGHNGESELIDSLRTSCANYLSLVGSIGNELIGHVLFTPVVIRTPSVEMEGMGLAPMSVRPRHQNQGIGTMLVSAGLNRLFENGCLFVAVLGHPHFYKRFGFCPASKFEISHGFEGIPQDVFYVHPGSSGLSELRGGKVYFRREFGPQYGDSI